MRAIGIVAIVLGGIAILACETHLPGRTAIFIQGTIGLAAVFCGAGCIAMAKVDVRLKALEASVAETHDLVRSLRPSAGENDTERVIEQLREAGLLNSEGELSDQEIDASLY